MKKDIPFDLHPGFWTLLYLVGFVAHLTGLLDVNMVVVTIAIAIATILRKIEHEFSRYRVFFDYYDAWRNFYNLWLKDGKFPMSGNEEKDKALHEISRIMEV